MYDQHKHLDQIHLQYLALLLIIKQHNRSLDRCHSDYPNTSQGCWGEHYRCVLVWTGEPPWEVVTAVVKGLWLRWAVWPSSRCSAGQLFPRDLCPWKPTGRVHGKLTEFRELIQFHLCVNFHFQEGLIDFYKKKGSRQVGILMNSSLNFFKLYECS